MTNLTIALDAMGGDSGPPVTIPAVLDILITHPNLNVIICGDENILAPFLAKAPASLCDQIQTEHCTQIVSMSDKPSQALRQKTDSSMRKALELVKADKAQACVSAGNTGALLAMAYYVLKMLPGINRPALVTAMPSLKGDKTYLLDLGANIAVDETALHQFALMGSVLAEDRCQKQKPRVALLNVGEEEIKGCEVVKRAARLLNDDKQLNYVGYVEGDDIFSDKADVIVCDGYVGNVSLKACEGIAKLVIESLKSAVGESWFTRILAALAMPALKKIYKKVNPDQYNGASLLGLRGIVIKSHGNASKEGFKYAIIEAVNEIEHKVPEKIRHKLENTL